MQLLKSLNVGVEEPPNTVEKSALLIPRVYQPVRYCAICGAHVKRRTSSSIKACTPAVMTPKFLPGYPVLWAAETIRGPNAALQNEQGSQTSSADCPRLLCPPRGDSGQQLQLCMGAQHRIELGEGNGPDKVCSQMLANQSWPGDHNQSHRGTDLHIANKSRARKAKTSIKYMHIPLIHLVLHAFFNECNWSSFGPFAKLLVPLVPRYHFPFVSLSLPSCSFASSCSLRVNERH